MLEMENGSVPEDQNDKKLRREKTIEGRRLEGKLLYSIEDKPPWHTSLVLGLQHYLMMVESTVSIPYLLTPIMCMDENDPSRAAVASTIIFVSGVVTLMQTTFGIRLPIVQGGTTGFLGPTLAILSLMKCPPEEVLDGLSEDARMEVWQERMRMVQGAICAASFFQIFVGFTGIVGAILKWITPLVIAPTVSLIGLSLFPVAAERSASNWPIAILTIVLLILFSQYLGEKALPAPSYSRKEGFHFEKIYLFKLFPVLFAVCVSWFVCYLLTASNYISPQNKARTDLRLDLIRNSSWLFFPYPCQWGVPTATLAGVFGILTGVLASIVESIGDYYACAKLAEAPPPPTHAMNRGIWIEGVGTLIAGLYGTGSGTTSYSQNIGAIGVTKVGSRRVIQYGGLIMILCGIVGKVGAVFIIIPEPIIGGIFCVVFAMITSVGLAALQYVDLTSTRNLFILGFSLFFGMTLPLWLTKSENRAMIATSIPTLDNVLFVLLSTSMFVGGFLGFFLDNTIPGTPEERGIVAWNKQLEGNEDPESSGKDHKDTYIPAFLGKKIYSWSCAKYLPISPTFIGWKKIRERWLRR